MFRKIKHKVAFFIKNINLLIKNIDITENKGFLNDVVHIIDKYESVMERKECIYIIKEREFIKTGENVYKIGMTRRHISERFKEKYGKKTIAK